MNAHNHITLSLDFGVYQLGTENCMIIKTINPTWSILSTETIFVLLYCLSSCFVHSSTQNWLLTTPWTAAHQASLSLTISQSLPVYVHCISNTIQSSHPRSPSSPFPFYLSQHQGFSNELTTWIRWRKYWSFSLRTSPSSKNFL